MIVVEFFNNLQKEIVGFNVSGHSGSAEQGKDIVCAAVSSATFMTVNTLTDVMQAKANVNVHPDGRIFLMLRRDEKPERCRFLLEGFRLHMEGLEEQYGNYIRINDVEV